METKGTLSVLNHNSTGALSTTNDATGSIVATANDITGSLCAIDNSIYGEIAANIEDRGELAAQFEMRKGIDGYSPSIDVAIHSPVAYVLKITNAGGSYYTPNLLSTVDIAEQLSKKVDKNLSSYEEVASGDLFVSQGSSNVGYKISLSKIATKIEVDNKIKTTEQPDINWSVGQYRFIEVK